MFDKDGKTAIIIKISGGNWSFRRNVYQRLYENRKEWYIFDSMGIPKKEAESRDFPRDPRQARRKIPFSNV